MSYGLNGSLSALLAIAPLVLAASAPNTASVAAPKPVPIALPNPQGHVPSLIDGVFNAASLAAAVPAIVSDLGNLLDATGTVTGRFFSSPFPSNRRMFSDRFAEEIVNGTILSTDVPAVVQKLFQAVKPTATPTSVEDAISKADSA